MVLILHPPTNKPGRGLLETSLMRRLSSLGTPIHVDPHRAGAAARASRGRKPGSTIQSSFRSDSVQEIPPPLPAALPGLDPPRLREHLYPWCSARQFLKVSMVRSVLYNSAQSNERDSTGPGSQLMKSAITLTSPVGIPTLMLTTRSMSVM